MGFLLLLVQDVTLIHFLLKPELHLPELLPENSGLAMDLTHMSNTRKQRRVWSRMSCWLVPETYFHDLYVTLSPLCDSSTATVTAVFVVIGGLSMLPSISYCRIAVKG